MLTYMDAFSRFRTLTTLNQLETLMSGYPQLETFERAQLGKASFGLYDLLTCSQCHSNALPG
jgi:hypothetical protein